MFSALGTKELQFHMFLRRNNEHKNAGKIFVFSCEQVASLSCYRHDESTNLIQATDFVSRDALRNFRIG
jgi:hypothetical protein